MLLLGSAVVLGPPVAQAAAEPGSRKCARTPDSVVRYVAPNGSDRSPGTARRPWATLAGANRRARPGMTIVLRAGAYGAQSTVTRLSSSGRPDAPIRYVSASRRGQVRIHGQLRIWADNVQVCGIVAEGPTGPIARGTASSYRDQDVGVWIYGDSVQLSDSVVRDHRGHAGVYLYRAENARVLRNHIHDNGQFSDPDQANLDHGVYWDSGSGLLAGNLIEANYAYGVQLYPTPHDVKVLRNTIVRNGKGGVVIADEARDNLISHNVIAFHALHGIRVWELTGDGNAAVDNVFAWNGEADISGAGLSEDSLR